jgi:hypothetical protein
MKIEVFIFNYKHFKEASYLYKVFNDLKYKTYILNCESANDPAFEETDTIIKFPNIYYSGQWNEALRLADGDVLFIINADVTILKPAFVMNRLKKFYEYFGDKAGLYAPDCYWTPWTYNPHMLENTEFGYSKVPATDSTIWSVSRDIAEEVGTIDTNVNLFGWGIEIVAAYYCYLKNKLVVRDYHTKCLHPESTAYNRYEADVQWRKWAALKGLGEDFWKYYNSRDKYGFGWNSAEYRPKPLDYGF